MSPALTPRGQGPSRDNAGHGQALLEGQDKQATRAGTWKPLGLEVSSLGCWHPAFPPQDYIRLLSLLAIRAGLSFRVPW